MKLEFKIVSREKMYISFYICAHFNFSIIHISVFRVKKISFKSFGNHYDNWDESDLRFYVKNANLLIFSIFLK